VDITYLGHSCFQLRGRDTDLLTDPFPPEMGYSLNGASAHIITVSHPHRGHSYSEGVAGEGRVVAGPGEYEVRGVFIQGIPTFHDAEGGRDRGRNTAFRLEMDGLRLAHLGDLGHLPGADLVAALKDVDVLFLPVGGHSTISPEEAVKVVGQLHPRVTIPMHYAAGASQSPLCGVEDFLKAAGARSDEGGGPATPRPRLSISPTTLPASPQIVVLDCSR
jgi:L-ascorbate metabolism protein UlaG (beta-lactamase superfamily)